MVLVRRCGVDRLHQRLFRTNKLHHESVKCTGKIPASVERVWSLVRNFHGTWHPAINTMEIEHDNAGRLIRALTVHGEQTIYRERLTWFSDCEHSFAYTHIEGIEGAQEYRAQLSVSFESDTECSVTMSAQLTAASPRSSQITAGTKAIFESAISTIDTLMQGTRSKNANVTAEERTNELKVGENHATTQIIPGSPTLTVSRIDGPREDILCLFLHGIGGNKENWHKQLRAIAPYCTTPSLDLRGYGESDLGEQQSTVEDYCNDILRVLDTFKAKKLILCGLSFGAWIATSFAVRHPDRLAGLVLSGGCTGMSEASSEERESFLSSREVPMSEGKTPADFAPSVVTFLSGPDCTDDVKNELLSSMSAITSENLCRCFTLLY